MPVLVVSCTLTIPIILILSIDPAAWMDLLQTIAVQHTIPLLYVLCLYAQMLCFGMATVFLSVASLKVSVLLTFKQIKA